MSSDSTEKPMSAEAQLALSRAALFGHVNRNAARAKGRMSHMPDEPVEFVSGLEDPADGPDAYPEDEQHSPWTLGKRAARAWWQYHPARTALAVGEPFLEDYAERHPWKLVGYAAGVGALVVVTRPWRLVSLTGLLVAAVRSSQLSAVVASVLAPDKKKP